MLILRAALVLCLCAIGSAQAEWRVHHVPTPGVVAALERSAAETLIAIGPHWYRFAANTKTLMPAQAPQHPTIPVGALIDARVAQSDGSIVRAWLAAPTSRYRHGVLGDAIEAGSMVIDRRDGYCGTIVLRADAVFEDLLPRIVLLGGREKILVVKSYLDRGSALAVIDVETMSIIAETPPIGRANAWLNPAGVADYDGDGTTDIAIIRQPHVLGRLELWSWQNGNLKKVAEAEGFSNHVIGSRALEMSWTADFNGDGRPDLAVPSLDRRAIRLVAFYPHIQDIASIPLPARITTNIGAMMIDGRVALVAGLDNGQLIVIQNK